MIKTIQSSTPPLSVQIVGSSEYDLADLIDPPLFPAFTAELDGGAHYFSKAA
jgi:hypothetical protein